MLSSWNDTVQDWHKGGFSFIIKNKFISAVISLDIKFLFVTPTTYLSHHCFIVQKVNTTKIFSLFLEYTQSLGTGFSD
jgi:hypothetical protein